MKYNLKSTISFLYILSLTFLTYASDTRLEEGAIRPTPIAIKIMSKQKQEILSHEFGIFTSTHASRKDCNVNHYPSNYGEGFLFEYDTEYKDNESKDKIILEKLGKYRDTSLKDRDTNPNPLIVRFKAYTNNISEEIFSLFTGVFVSGEKTYKVQDNKGKDVGTEAFDLKLIGFEGSIFRQLDKSINIPIEIKDSYEKRRKDKELENEIQEILKRKNDDYQKEIKISLGQKLIATNIESTISPAVIYTVPCLKVFNIEQLGQYFLKHNNTEKNIFPITIYDFFTNVEGLEEAGEMHFKKVVQRLFKYDLGNKSLGKKNKENKSIKLGISLQDRFIYHLLRDRDSEQLSNKLFNKKIFNDSFTEGCFETEFIHNFTDSEQAFLNWIDSKENAKYYLLENISNFKNISNNKPISIDRIDIEFLSYLDMCPMCRGTMSLLYTNTSDENEGWLNKKIKDIFTECIEEDKAILSPTFSLNLKCISLQKCNKGLLR